MRTKQQRSNGCVSRRNFIGLMAGAAVGWVLLPGWARGRRPPLAPDYPLHNIPVDKQIDASWLKGLYDRGLPTTYLKSKNELKYIGMPAGGLHSGTLYLGGDGRYWLWEIYNDAREGIFPRTVQWFDGAEQRDIRNRDGANYVEPAVAGEHRKLQQGFALKIISGEDIWVKRLQESDWDEIRFTATYPRAKIEYTDAKLPVKVVMTAGAFYIPLREDDSSLPATAVQLEITATGTAPAEVSVAGWLENGVGKDTCKEASDGRLRSEGMQLPGASGIFHTGTLKDTSARDQGSMCLALIGQPAVTGVVAGTPAPEKLFSQGSLSAAMEAPCGQPLIGSVATQARKLQPGESFKADYVISWHFNHSLVKLRAKMAEASDGYAYGRRFSDAKAVMQYIGANFDRLTRLTTLWQDTYYDSSLPHWLLERSVINVGTIATANTYRFASGRFWGWEGVNACEGTCTHVWQYGQALARLFPALERDTRSRVDLGTAMSADGAIAFRGEFDTRPAIDGQAGTILRIYREHLMSVDDSFLRSHWDRVKKAIGFVLAQDKNGDGMTDTPMENTLDAVWEGEIAWIVGLCIAAVKAGQMMAAEMGDLAFKKICEAYVRKGSDNMTRHLFNGEYFIHRPDAVAGRRKLGAYNTCHIDQVYGQSWAFQVGLGRLWDEKKTHSALRALWKYNFAPDVGPYIKTHPGGRPYALAGEAGMIMNTNPYNEKKPYGENVSWQLGYFHECMSGFEHQVAAHMMAEGMTDEALVLTRSIHDRYHGGKRNPYNEIECSDHYARAMASYGTFISACGFYYHGPKGILGFAPKLGAKDFKAPFTAAGGWGSYQQQLTSQGGSAVFSALLELKYGTLALSSLRLTLPGPALSTKKLSVSINNRRLSFAVQTSEGGPEIVFDGGIGLTQNDRLEIRIG